MGPHLGNNLVNLGMYSEVREAVSEMGFDLDELLALEEGEELAAGARAFVLPPVGHRDRARIVQASHADPADVVVAEVARAIEIDQVARAAADEAGDLRSLRFAALVHDIGKGFPGDHTDAVPGPPLNE